MLRQTNCFHWLFYGKRQKCKDVGPNTRSPPPPPSRNCSFCKLLHTLYKTISVFRKDCALTLFQDFLACNRIGLSKLGISSGIDRHWNNLKINLCMAMAAYGHMWAIKENVFQDWKNLMLCLILILILLQTSANLGRIYMIVILSICLFILITHFFYKELRSGLSTQSFLAFCDFEYSKFLNSFLTFFVK